MLLLILALQAVTAPPATVHRARHLQHVRRVQRVQISRRARPVILAQDARWRDARAAEASNRYRLTGVTELREDPKQAALRGPWQNCGTTGMPVCPSKPRPLIRAPLDD
jgi:hypothetical protein